MPSGSCDGDAVVGRAQRIQEVRAVAVTVQVHRAALVVPLEPGLVAAERERRQPQIVGGLDRQRLDLPPEVVREPARPPAVAEPIDRLHPLGGDLRRARREVRAPAERRRIRACSRAARGRARAGGRVRRRRAPPMAGTSQVMVNGGLVSLGPEGVRCAEGDEGEAAPTRGICIAALVIRRVSRRAPLPPSRARTASSSSSTYDTEVWTRTTACVLQTRSGRWAHSLDAEAALTYQPGTGRRAGTANRERRIPDRQRRRLHRQPATAAAWHRRHQGSGVGATTRPGRPGDTRSCSSVRQGPATRSSTR